jgi:NAD-dependent dihydropyrimidine dehydrogenase PreA subunit
MTYVIAEPCIDVLDRACVEECPVDCIYEGGRSLYIHPDECVDCGACEPVCPVEAIFYEDDLPAKWSLFAADNARFFAEPMPGADAALESPGGASKIGRRGVDTALVSGFPSGPA